MRRLIADAVHWGVAPCENCGEPAQAILDETQLVCFYCVELILDRAEAVNILPSLRRTLPSFSDQFRLEPR